MNARALTLFGARAFQSALQRLPSPYKLTFSLTQRCNLRCTSCNIWRSRGREELSHEEIDRFFRANPHLMWVDLTGGEITLREDIIAIAHSAVRLPRLFQFHFPTNGTLPDRAAEVARVAVERGVPKVVVSVSVDGPPAVHDALRGKAGTWDRAVETYVKVRGIGAEAYFGMTVSGHNLNALFPCLEALSKRVPGFTPRDLHVNIAHSTFYYGAPSVPPLDIDEASSTIARFVRTRGFPRNPVLLLEMLYLRKVPQYLRTKRSPVRCQALSSSVFVNHAGDVFPCTTFEHRLGNLRDVGFDLARLWHDPSTVSLASAIGRGQCPGCWTPCEAYQSIIARIFSPSTWRSKGSEARRSS